MFYLSEKIIHYILIPVIALLLLVKRNQVFYPGNQLQKFHNIPPLNNRQRRYSAGVSNKKKPSRSLRPGFPLHK